MRPFVDKKVKKTCEKLAEWSEQTVKEIEELFYIPSGYKKGSRLPAVDRTWNRFERGSFVQGADRHFWFAAKIHTPEAEAGKEIILKIRTGNESEWDATNPQGLLYLNGEIRCGMDMNHHCTALEPDTDYEILFYLYTGSMQARVDVLMDVKLVDLQVRKLYYDMKVPYDAAMCFEEKDYSYIRTMKHLEHACNLIPFSEKPESEEWKTGVGQAIEYLQKEYYEKECGTSEAVVSLIGHTHIDVAWLWTLDQTREKVQRTFSTVLMLMERYPEYVFMSSQPQLYEYLKEEAPELYEKVREKVKEGRFEVEGAMWLEADCNLTSGESLVRQILYGKRFMKEEFGVDSHILWLPDVFGYSAALPQILKKSGVDRFVTSKISWNSTNKLPMDSFLWEGIDGTEIFTYFLTAREHEKRCADDTRTTYVGTTDPAMVLGTWERYQQKDYNNETLITFGYGDGGGGPTEEMLETARRTAAGLPGIPRTQMSFASDFLDRVEENFEKHCNLTGQTPKWTGELYLELHRGTYTSMARNKKNNRECEFLCQTTETLGVANELWNLSEYPAENLHRAWKTLLLNQFHDIIPGSSIRQVYEESDLEYAQVRSVLGREKAQLLSKIGKNSSREGILVYNPNSFEASGLAEYNGTAIYAKKVPPLGWKVVEKPEVDDTTVLVGNREIESSHYRIRFDENMQIASLYDKDNDREAIREGCVGNQLQLFEDVPQDFDNWEITEYYRDKMQVLDQVSWIREIRGDGFGGYEITRSFHNSRIIQKIVVYENSRRIDFVTTADWREHHMLLKTAFPTTVHTNKATYDIQFGNAERNTHSNTSWDAAKFEVCAQKWGDLSEEGYGVSLLNNCKYGYSAQGSEISLTLIKCGTYPNEEADQGAHSFIYSLLPHAGSFKTGGTIEEAYLLNRPFETTSAEGNGDLPAEYSLISCDSRNVMIETVKAAENGTGIIVRLFDAWDMKSHPVLHFGFQTKAVYVCDMLENEIQKIGSGSEVKIDLANFEIVTLKII